MRFRGVRLLDAAAWGLALACASANQTAVARGRDRLKELHQYGVPPGYEAQVEAWFGQAALAPGSLLLAEPSGAVACGHVRAKDQRGEHPAYLPFGAIFDRAGTLRTVRVFEPFQGMYATAASDGRPTDDDIAVAMACDVPLVFR